MNIDWIDGKFVNNLNNCNLYTAMAKTNRPVQKAEMLNEVTIAEIREIFTLFDKNADGYVATTELGTIIRGLGHNPTERDVADMQRDVDPNQTGSFD